MRRHLTYANLVSTIALLVAVAGGSTAVAISAKNAPKNSVTAKSIKPRNVTAADLTGVRVISLPLQFQNSGTITCPQGERLLSGGANPVGELQRSYPTNDGNGWIASANSPLTLYAVCLRKKPGK